MSTPLLEPNLPKLSVKWTTAFVGGGGREVRIHLDLQQKRITPSQTPWHCLVTSFPNTGTFLFQYVLLNLCFLHLLSVYSLLGYQVIRFLTKLESRMAPEESMVRSTGHSQVNHQGVQMRGLRIPLQHIAGRQPCAKPPEKVGEKNTLARVAAFTGPVVDFFSMTSQPVLVPREERRKRLKW